MKRVTVIVFGFVFLIVAITYLRAAWHPFEPSYHGKALSFWLQGYIPGREDEFPKAQADEAMNRIGTNAIPTLLRLIQERDLFFWKYKWVTNLEKKYTAGPGHIQAWERNFEGLCGFKDLGANAKDAVPALIEIYRQNRSDESKSAAISSLGAIGPAARDAVPFLIKELKPNSWEFFQALGEIHCDPDLVVPVLIEHLKDTQRDSRKDAVRALGAFGPDAKPALSAILDALNDQEVFVRREASNALLKIDPIMAAKAGVK